MGKVTIKHVAMEAGVSVATASNALNNPDIVRPRTREQVLAAAERLGYVPNANGKRLRAKESRAVGLFVEVISGEYYGALADAMQRVCQANGYELHICLGSNVASVQQKLRDRTLDGAVVFIDGVDEAAASLMQASGCPLVFLGMELKGPRASGMLYASEEHGRMAARYLLGLGKRRLMHVYGLPDNYDSRMRRQGFYDELAKRGIPAEAVVQLEGRFERAAAYREMRKHLREGHAAPEAVFAANDLSATGCVAALNEAGYRVPEDVSVLGCDDISLCEYLTPALTTIRTHFQETGEMAAMEVLRLIRGEPGRLLVQNGTLVVRQSCKITEKGMEAI